MFSSPQRLVFAGVLLILVLIIFGVGGQMDKSVGLSNIKTNVNQQLSALIIESQNLKGITIEQMTGTSWKGSSNSLQGYFKYDATRNGNSKAQTLYVYWSKNLTNCQIEKIKLMNTYGSDPSEVIWERR